MEKPGSLCSFSSILTSVIPSPGTSPAANSEILPEMFCIISSALEANPTRTNTTMAVNFFIISIENYTFLKKKIGKLGVIVCIESKQFNEQIKDFGHKLAMHIAASNPLAIEVSQLDKKMLEKENEIIGEELRNSSKEAKIIEKISKGKFEKFKQENTLINQIWIMDPKKKVKDVIAELGNENSITIKDFVRYKVGE